MVRAVDYERGGLQKESYLKEEVIKRPCPLCGGDNFTDIYKERGAIGVVRCLGCGLIYTNPIVKDAHKNYWGKEEKYYDEARLIFKGLAKSHRDPNYIQDLDIIKRWRPHGNFLDIGTNVGFFLRHTRGQGWNVYGVEPSPSLSEMARKHFSLNVRTGYLDEAGFESDFFDVVTMTDVFEHIARPRDILGQIKRVLKKDGILFIKVPNGDYNMLKLRLAGITGALGDYDIFDSYEHLSHYTHKTLKKMLEGSGFRIRRVFIGSPIQLPVWQRYVGHFYEYPTPWALDVKNRLLRTMFYYLSRVEYWVRFRHIGCFAPNIIVIAQKDE